LRKVIEDPDNNIVISIASLLELAIKIGSTKRKLEIGISLFQVQQYIKNSEVELMDIQFDTLITLSELPHHHGDPFDRILIAQCISENLSIISVDRYFKAYPIIVIQ